jgi:hypothetical protein
MNFNESKEETTQEELIREKPKPFWKGMGGNFYIWFAVAFVVWMLFLDGNDLANQYIMYKKLENLESEKAFYETEIKKIQEEHEALFSNPKLLQKFARQKYLMKKKGEDIYLIED